MKIHGIGVTWLGHATLLIETPEGKTLLVDPWTKSSPVCPADYHEFRPDAILVTHGHNDHTGDLVAVAKASGAPVVCIHEIAMFLNRRGHERTIGMNKGGTVSIPGLDVRVSMTDARHSSTCLDEDGTVQYLGEAAGFVVHFSDATRIYIAGDTALFGDMQLIQELWEPQAAILPIGDHYTMDPRQAAMACRLLGVDTVIPCHYGTFPVLSGTPAQLRSEIDRMGLEVNVVELEIGG